MVLLTEGSALGQRLGNISTRLDALIDSVRGLEGDDLLAELDADDNARSLGELVADLQPLLHATATPDGPEARGLFAATRFLAGYTSYLMGRAEPALACMRLATAWWGAPAGWHYLLAQIAASAEEPSEAEQAYAETIARDPRFRPAYIDLMGMLSDRGDMIACRKLAASAASMTPTVHWTDPWQRPDHMMAGLQASPWHDTGAFPWCAMLEANAAVIRAELLAVVRSQRKRKLERQSGWEAVGTHQRAEFGSDRTLVSEGGSWREFVLLGEPDDPEDEAARLLDGGAFGGIVEANCRRCPRTAALLRSIPEIVRLAEAGLGEALFSSLAPGSKLRPHCGGTNTRLTCHLGLILGSGKCGIKCGGEERCWEEGKCLVFDDSFEHEVYHDEPAAMSTNSQTTRVDPDQNSPTHECDGERVVLLMRFWHPDLSRDGHSNHWAKALEDVERAITTQMEAALPRVALQEVAESGSAPVPQPTALSTKQPPKQGQQRQPEPEPEQKPEPEPDMARRFCVKQPSQSQITAAAQAAVRIEERAQRLAAAAQPVPLQDEFGSESDESLESDVSSGVD